jgi:hypothetical protein
VRTRAVRAFALAVLPVLLGGACAKGTSSEGSLGLTPGAIAAAAVRTTAAKSARMHMVMKATGVEETAGEPQDFQIVADGRMELGRARGVLTMDIGSLGLPGAAGKMEIRFIDTVAYMKMPLDEELPLPAGKKWMKLDFGAMASEEGFNFSDFQSFGMGDPAEILSFLKEAGSVTRIGSETIRGTKATHYKATIDLTKVVADADEADRAELKQLFGSSGEGLPMDVWIGADGLLRRMDFVMNLSGLEGAGKEAKMAMRMEMFDFGISLVDVVAPPAAEVVDFAEMMDEGGEEPAA